MDTPGDSVPLPIPSRLLDLIDAGRWPMSLADCNLQNIRPSIFEHVPAEWIEEGELLSLSPPPFVTVARCHDRESFWDEFGAPGAIDYELAVPIGDWGLGSDAPLILDYRGDRDRPTVKRLRWSEDREQGNRWEEIAASFDEFADRLRLEEVDWHAAHVRQTADEVRRMQETGLFKRGSFRRWLGRLFGR